MDKTPVEYLQENLQKSYDNWGDGVSKALYTRAFLDGYKTAMAQCMMQADEIIDRKMEEQIYGHDKV